MSEDKTFTELMTDPDEENLAKAWVMLMRLAKGLEEKDGISRDTICKAFLIGTLDLVKKRDDERYFREFGDVRYFLRWASEYTRQKLDQYPCHRKQEELEKRFGRESLGLRDAKNFGWREDKNRKKH